jgi:hypothetical protein
MSNDSTEPKSNLDIWNEAKADKAQGLAASMKVIMGTMNPSDARTKAEQERAALLLDFDQHVDLGVKLADAEIGKSSATAELSSQTKKLKDDVAKLGELTAQINNLSTILQTLEKVVASASSVTTLLGKLI